MQEGYKPEVRKPTEAVEWSCIDGGNRNVNDRWEKGSVT